MSELSEDIQNATVVLSELQKKPDNIQLLRSLGDLLRSPEVRSSAVVFENLPSIVKKTNYVVGAYLNSVVDSSGGDKEYTSEPAPLVLLEALRVLVNLTADNSANRDYFTSENYKEVAEFWNRVSNCLVIDDKSESGEQILTRVVLFMSQFIYNTDNKVNYLNFLYGFDLHTKLYGAIRRISSVEESEFDPTDAQNLIEFTQEYFTANNEKIIRDEVFQDTVGEYLSFYTWFLEVTFTNFKKISESADEDDLDETISNIIDIILVLTSFDELESIDKIHGNAKILNLLKLIPSGLSSLTMDRRKLFSISGQISSMKNFNNVDDLKLALDYFQEAESNSVDPYVIAASSIILGNYVTTREKSDFVIQFIDDTIGLDRFYHIYFQRFAINDVIQIQAVHLLSNIMTDDNAKRILDNYDQLNEKFSKIIVDNGKYYPEVLNIYLKFIKHLIKVRFVDTRDHDVMKYISLWSYLFTNIEESISINEVKLLMVQALIQFQGTEQSDSSSPEIINCVKDALKTAISPLSSNSTTITYILEKLKTLGILFHTLVNNGASLKFLVESYFGNSIEALRDEFIRIYRDFLVQLKLQILVPNPSSTASQFNVLSNNAKFVCGTTISFLKNQDIESDDQLDELIQEILSICLEVAKGTT